MEDESYLGFTCDLGKPKVSIRFKEDSISTVGFFYKIAVASGTIVLRVVDVSTLVACVMVNFHTQAL